MYYLYEDFCMRKIIYFVCGILILWLIIENANFIYAENNEESWMIEDNEVLVDEEINNLENENNAKKILTENELTEIMTESDINYSDSLDESGEIQTFEVTQVYQEIPTSGYGIIRIKDPDNKWKWITLLDRNLWASATWAGIDESMQSFWYYFQWWNNYGFPSNPSESISSTGTKVDASEYWPNTANGYYSSNIFIKWTYDWSTMHNNNLRWWSWDSRDGNDRGYPVENPVDRRWPCPENYHIPSIWEWNKLIKFWTWEYSGVSLSKASNGLYSFTDNEPAVNAFYQRFYLPIAGQRDNNGSIGQTGKWIMFWTSSPNSSTDSFRIYLNSNNMYAGAGNSRIYAFPIRCFYNSYRLPVIITYDINWWYWSWDANWDLITITYTSNDGETYNSNIKLPIPGRNANCWESGNKKCMFGWWYNSTGDMIWTWDMSEDANVYANRLAFEDKNISLSGVSFNIIDRNLWAQNSWTGESAYGYYLTWEAAIVCPEWYHVPNTWEWLWIQNLLGSDFDWNEVKSLFDLPFAWKFVNNEVVEAWENGYYLAKDGNDVMYAKVSNSGIVIYNLNDWEKVSVRCFKNYNTWTIKFDSKGWNEINDVIAVNWWKNWEDLEEPERDNSIFLWWYTTSDFQEWTKIGKNINYKNEEEINLYAKWKCGEWYQENGNKCEKIEKKSGWSSGGGSRWSHKDDISNDSKESTDINVASWADSYVTSNESGESDKQMEKNTYVDLPTGPQDNKVEWQNDFSQEFIDAYKFAYKNWITSKPSIYDAKMYSPITRIQMAKMISNYAINILWKAPDISKWTKKFNDVSKKLNKQYDNAVTLSYQLWIMWQNIESENFRPNDTLTRAEFTTVLSRLLYWTKDGRWNQKYYEPHISRLYREWIINKTNPNMEEKRWYVMIMLMRSVK